MSLYGNEEFYGDITLYGTDENNNPPGNLIGLTSYQNVDGSVILYWGMEPCSPVMSAFTWTVQTDLVSTFDSVNLKTYTSVLNPNFIAGGVHKGMVVDSYTREQGTSTPMYWRVQGHYAGNDTNFAISIFETPEAIDDIVRQAMLDTLPDVIYKKDFTQDDFQIQSLVFNGELVTGNVFNLNVDGVPIAPVTFSVSNAATMAVIAAEIAARPGVGSAIVQSGNLDIRVTANAKDLPIVLANPVVTGGATQPQISIIPRNSSNINNIYKGLGLEFDEANMELILTYNDIFTQSVRDASLQNNFAFLVGLHQPSMMQTIDFREIVRTMIREAGGTPSLGSIKRVLNTIYCTDPDFILIRDTIDMYINDPDLAEFVGPFYVDDPFSAPPVLPATVWDDANLAFGVIIKINNPMGLSIPVSFVQDIVGKMAPAHAPVYLQF